MNRDRLLLAAPALACAGLLGFGYYLQYFDGQDPCPLCMVQRGFFYLVLAASLVAAVHFPQRTGRRIYCAAAFLAALGGFGVAARHVWLQHLPADQVPACGPDLFYMMENLPVQPHAAEAVHGLGPVRGGTLEVPRPIHCRVVARLVRGSRVLRALAGGEAAVAVGTAGSTSEGRESWTSPYSQHLCNPRSAASCPASSARSASSSSAGSSR